MSESMNLYQALLAAQRDFGKVVKSNTNPAFRSKYADLGDVLDAVTTPLRDHGLLVVQRLDYDNLDGVLVPVLLTELIHADTGERLTSRALVGGKDPTDPQKVGSAVTYMRRYSLLALLNLTAEDDDGNTASKPAEGQPAARGFRTAVEIDAERDAKILAAGGTVPGTPQTSSAAPRAAGMPQKVADWSNAELLAYAEHEANLPVKRKAAFGHYLARLDSRVAVFEACDRMTALHPEDLAQVRDKAVRALDAKTPVTAGV